MIRGGAAGLSRGRSAWSGGVVRRVSFFDEKTLPAKRIWQTSQTGRRYVADLGASGSPERLRCGEGARLDPTGQRLAEFRTEHA